MLRLQVIVASIREGRRGPYVSEWFLERAREHGGFEVEKVDLAEIDLPLMDEPNHPRLQQYEREYTRQWSELVSRGDAYVIVTPEYDYSAPPPLINALTYLFKEWAYKPVGFVSYGGVSAGLRSVEVTKQTVTALKMMPIPEAVSIPFFQKHIDEEGGSFDPGELQEKAAVVMLDELLRWAEALRPLRG